MSELLSTPTEILAELEADVETSKRTRRTKAWMIVKEQGSNPIALLKVIGSFNHKDLKENKMLVENGHCVIENMKTGDVKSIAKTLEAVSEGCVTEILYEAPESSATTSPKSVDMDGFVTLSGYFKVEKATYNILLSNIKARRSSMLLGPTGVGKTELVKNIADSLGLPLTIFDMGTMSDPIMSLVGTHTISVKDDKTVSEFIPSRFSEVIQKPGVILLDELSR